MKNLKIILFGIGVLFFESCASTAKFPVSEITPAADITAKMKQDKNENYTIEVTAKKLSSADRLNPSMNIYIVWVVTEENGVKNIGQLVNENAEKSILETSTPFNVKEIFITAEREGNISYPSSIEIARTSFE